MKPDSNNNPISNYSRVVIEKENSELIAVITNDGCEVADGFRIRLKPVYPRCISERKDDKCVR